MERKDIPPKGRLYSTLRYRLGEFRKTLTKTEKKDYYKYQKYWEEPPPIEELTSTETEIEIKNWLQINFEPWSSVLHKWKQTCKLMSIDLRDMTFKDILEEWPRLKKRIGYELLYIDFLFVYPEKDLLKLQ